MTAQEPHILLIEDDPDLGRALELALASQQMRVTRAECLASAEACLSSCRHDLVLLDLMLPDGSGLAVLETLRHPGSPPVLIVSALDSLAQRIEGLDFGAAGYLVKPFAFEELLARIRALLRRSRADSPPDLPAAGEVRFDADQRRLIDGERLITLTVTEWAALDLLRRAAGSPVSKSSLQEALYDGSPAGNNATEVMIHRLRGKLKGIRLRIRTVRGAGYVLDAGI